ncbi:hypothetical protein [Cohnella lupini]|uniref:LysM domain-containing protein n=1 Tax=Cohnella lupini TaxID=1294267 RepID=A0A3D9IT48_9BACL|nr:hypothetical protein [Cohnella lupini]RED64932.1 hypothetical protein DFP95_102354 [Cohnella lupini]
MNNKVRTLGITAALAVMIPLSAYAATTTGSSTDEKKVESAWTAKGAGGLHEDRGAFKRGEGFVSQEVLDVLKLDKDAFEAKIQAGSTLAKIAEEQGVSRENLKSAMTEGFNKKLEEKKQAFADNLDAVIDSDLQAMKHGRGGKGGIHARADFTAVAAVLGVSAEDLKVQLEAGKSLADLAKEKSIDVQKLIDAQAGSITSQINQAVKDGKLTQEQADKRLADVTGIAEKIVNGKGFGFGDERHHEGGHGRGFGGKDHGFGGEKPPKDSVTDAAEPTASSS